MISNQLFRIFFLWSESLIVACFSNGDLYKLNVSESEFTLDEKLSGLHNLLISGDQDGVINLIDFRTDTRIATFNHDQRALFL
jgi:hypothetical protein